MVPCGSYCRVDSPLFLRSHGLRRRSCDTWHPDGYDDEHHGAVRGSRGARPPHRPASIGRRHANGERACVASASDANDQRDAAFRGVLQGHPLSRRRFSHRLAAACCNGGDRQRLLCVFTQAFPQCDFWRLTPTEIILAEMGNEAWASRLQASKWSALGQLRSEAAICLGQLWQAFFSDAFFVLMATAFDHRGSFTASSLGQGILGSVRTNPRPRIPVFTERWYLSSTTGSPWSLTRKIIFCRSSSVSML